MTEDPPAAGRDLSPRVDEGGSGEVLDRRREVWGDVLRLVATSVWLPWVFIRRPGEFLLWAPMIAIPVMSIAGILAARRNFLPGWRRLVAGCIDAMLLVYLVWGLGSVTTPVMVFFVMAVIGTTMSAQPAIGLLVTVMVIVLYGAVLVLESRGILPIAPLANAGLAVHQTSGGRPLAFVSVALVCSAAYGFLLFARRNLEASAARERELRLAEQRAQREAAQLQQQLELAQRMESLGRLAGGVAHDFNNLLSVIQASFSFALDSEPLDRELREALEEGQSAARRAGLVVRQMLVFSRRQPLRARPVAPAQIITRARSLLARLAGPQVQLTVHLADDLGTVRADPIQIEQILMNLATNAHDAMPAGGTLRIAAANVTVNEPGGPAWPGASPGRYVEISVADTGHGMDKDTSRRAFEPFFTTKPVGKGTGLGLSTAFSIVRQHGGHVRIDSEPERGAKVLLLWPVCDEEPEALPIDSVESGRGSETVLLAEDEHALRAMIASAMRRNGYTVVEASCAEDALRAAEHDPTSIDVLVTDLVMPGMSGKELAARMRELRSGLPVLFISGFSPDAVDLQSLLQSGDRFLQKPFEPDQVMEQVRHLVDSQRSSNAEKT